MKENKMIRMIAAASLNSVIGQNNDLPWSHDYPEDLKFFKKMTINSTIIMGRKTFESMGSKPLPERRNIVLTRRVIPRPEAPLEHFLSLDSALKTCEGDVWIIGGSFVYQEGLSVAQEIYITTIPKTISGEGLVYFPYVNPDSFNIKEKIEISTEKNLHCNVYVKNNV